MVVASLTALLLIFTAGACRRKLPLSDAGPDAQTPQVSPPPAAPPCLEAPGSFAELGSRLRNNLVTLLGEPAEGSDPRAALPLSVSPLANTPSRRAEAALGSGFLLGPEGPIVTSHRIIGESPLVSIRLHDGTRLQSTLLGSSPDLDLALLALDQPAREAIELSDTARLRPGDWVALLSDPFGAGVSITAGVVRFRPGQESPWFPSELAPFAGVDATVDRANWGGLAVDAGGRVAGMAVSASSGGSRIGLLLPAAELRRRVAALTDLDVSTRTWIGLWTRTISAAEAAELGLEPPLGLLVTRIVPAGPADQAGLRPGDVILEFSGEPVRSPAALGALASRLGADQSADLLMWRESRQMIVRLRPAPMPH